MLVKEDAGEISFAFSFWAEDFLPSYHRGNVCFTPIVTTCINVVILILERKVLSGFLENSLSKLLRFWSLLIENKRT
jgi:hypothetical protein